MCNFSLIGFTVKKQSALNFRFFRPDHNRSIKNVRMCKINDCIGFNLVESLSELSPSNADDILANIERTYPTSYCAYEYAKISPASWIAMQLDSVILTGPVDCIKLNSQVF